MTNSGSIHLSGTAPTLFTGSLTNNDNFQIDAGATGIIGAPYSAFGSGTITNNGVLNFNSTFSGTHGIGGTGLSVFNGQVSTGTGAGSTANLSVGGNAVINSELFMRLTGTTRGSQYDAFTIGGDLSLGGTLHMELTAVSPPPWATRLTCWIGARSPASSTA